MTTGSNTASALDFGRAWMSNRGWTPQAFQEETWRAVESGQNGLLCAPTGTGKTYALFIPALFRASQSQQKGLKIIWISPVRALAREMESAVLALLPELAPQFQVGIRTGDTPPAERRKFLKNPPDILITTPESLHLLLATPGYPDFFALLQTVVVDEWHALLGSKRAVLWELAHSRLRAIKPKLQVWGISATLNSPADALYFLLGPELFSAALQIQAQLNKTWQVKTILPEQIDSFPWAGHLGIHLIDQVLPVLQGAGSCLLFTNTRAQAEIWYRELLLRQPDLAGQMAMHHGSISKEIRFWVEDALHEGKLKVVVCTSSLDLGVDFSPVDVVIQVGGPKGISRFIQRAGRSGHQPGQASVIYFVPTHALEILEGAALREAMQQGAMETLEPYRLCYDVLIQYLCTLAISEGFEPKETWNEIRATACFEHMDEEAYTECLQFIITGGSSLQQYEEFQKAELVEGRIRILRRGIAQRHRMNIGTISSEALLPVAFQGGGLLGHVEEWFAARLNPGDTFYLAGRLLELVRIRDMTVQVRSGSGNKGQVPSWQGGRMPLSSELGSRLRQQIAAEQPEKQTAERFALQPLLKIQQELSALPGEGCFLVEEFQSREGHHLFFFPFEGRFVHEGMAQVLAHRISRFFAISFSISMNDYGFELLSESYISAAWIQEQKLLTAQGLLADIEAGLNTTELASRRFRDIARIAGLVFQGYPGKTKKDRHLQASSRLFFEVFRETEPNHILLRQARQEVLDFQLEHQRLHAALSRLSKLHWHICSTRRPSPFAFPILVERIREKFSTETLADRIQKMKLRYQGDLPPRPEPQ